MSEWQPPRLVVKVIVFSFAMTSCVLAATFFLLSWQTQARLTRAIAEGLDASQTRFREMEAQRARDHRLRAAALAENPTLKASLDTYQTERSDAGSAVQLLATVQRELEKLQRLLDVPSLSVVDVRGVILASAGPAALDWRAGDEVPARVRQADAIVDTVVVRGEQTYLTTVVPLALGEDVVGQFCLATRIDDAYASRLSTEARTDVVIFREGRVLASSMPATQRGLLALPTLPESGTVALDGEDFVIRRLSAIDGAEIFALGSITVPVRSATREVAWVFLVIGLTALVLAGLASWWLARTLVAPIDRLRTMLADMAASRDFERPLPPGGSSLELDALAGTFDGLRQAVVQAEAESEATYLGVIRTLAEALDARDPYTAGHSERVAEISVTLGREMGLGEPALEAMRIGALLHDIGKIGVSDAVLRKPGTLTDEEFAHIKLHPILGARILKPLPFLADQIAIVELHHEQPDGHGYPHGLVGDQIPLAARIVHVADAFDAMTTARAYRPGRPAPDALVELRKHAGSAFDHDVVRAMTVLPLTALVQPAPSARLAASAAPSIARLLLQFRLRPGDEAASRRSAG